jgi:hypothetical protein
MAEWRERLSSPVDRVALAAGLRHRLAHCRPSERSGHCLAGGDQTPGGDEKRIPGGVGILFHIRGEKDPRQRFKVGTGHVVSPGKTGGIRAERNGTGSNWNAKRRQAQPAPRIKTPISPRVTKTLRKTELKSVISLCLGAFVVKKPFRFGGTGHVVSPSQSRRIGTFDRARRERDSAGTKIGSPGARGPVCWWWGSVFT